jgi:hypothetical protein
VTRATKQQETVVNIGDIAFIASSLGPGFYRVDKIHVDAAGTVTALTLSDPIHSSIGRSGQPAPIAIERITAVFANIFNPSQE